MRLPRPRLSDRATVRRAAVPLVVLAAATGIALACQVPVFRYALERWEPDQYEVTVVGADRLEPAQQEAVEFLRGATTGADGRTPANLRVTSIDSASAAAAPLSPDAVPAPVLDLPRLELRYPVTLRSFLPKPFWTGPVTMENAQKILHSPIRAEVVNRILQGNSATWILVESGNKEKDDTAAQSLESFCREAEKSLKIPEGVIGASEVPSTQYLPPSEAENVLQSEVPLKIAFAVVRLSRDDPAEEILANMLLNVEDDLHEYRNEPIAYPVFGRGRVLQPLIGAGLTAENVMFDSSYLCGACSCQVKEENPGIDLLVSAAWDSALSGSEVIVEKALPPLEGAGALAQAQSAGTEDASASVTLRDAPGENAAAASTDPASKLSPVRVLWIVIGVIALGVVLATVKLKRRSA